MTFACIVVVTTKGDTTTDTISNVVSMIEEKRTKKREDDTSSRNATMTKIYMPGVTKDDIEKKPKTTEEVDKAKNGGAETTTKSTEKGDVMYTTDVITRTIKITEDVESNVLRKEDARDGIKMITTARSEVRLERVADVTMSREGAVARRDTATMTTRRTTTKTVASPRDVAKTTKKGRVGGRRETALTTTRRTTTKTVASPRGGAKTTKKGSTGARGDTSILMTRRGKKGWRVTTTSTLDGAKTTKKGSETRRRNIVIATNSTKKEGDVENSEITAAATMKKGDVIARGTKRSGDGTTTKDPNAGTKTTNNNNLQWHTFKAINLQ